MLHKYSPNGGEAQGLEALVGDLNVYLFPTVFESAKVFVNPVPAVFQFDMDIVALPISPLNICGNSIKVFAVEIVGIHTY